MSREYETVVTVPVSYRNLPITKQVEGNLPHELEFYFKGSGFEMAGVHLNKKPDSILVDLTEFIGISKPGSIRTLNLSDQFKGDLKPFQVQPDEIAPGIASRKGKKVPVKFTADLRFRERFGKSGKIVLRPDSVDIAGPEATLEKIQSITTEPIVLNDLHKDYFGGASLKTGNISGLQVSPAYIHYFIPVEEYTEGSMTIPIYLPISQKGKVQLLTSDITVTYQVELSKYSTVRADDFKATAQVPFPETPPNIEVQLKKYPAYVHNIHWKPRYVEYLVKE